LDCRSSFFRPFRAKDDPIAVLLTLPAPPPPNPLVERERGERDPKFYDKKNPPNDNAPIGDLLSYWSQISTAYNDLRYSPETVRQKSAADQGRDRKEPDTAKLAA
jgi:hypothetical protein